MIGRIASLLVAAVYLVGASRSGGFGGACYTAFLLLIPLGLIWFGDWLGECTGWFGHGEIDQRSPGCMVKAMGWFFLGLPVLIPWIAASVSRM